MEIHNPHSYLTYDYQEGNIAVVCIVRKQNYYKAGNKSVNEQVGTGNNCRTGREHHSEQAKNTVRSCNVSWQKYLHAYLEKQLFAQRIPRIQNNYNVDQYVFI